MWSQGVWGDRVHDPEHSEQQIRDSGRSEKANHICLMWVPALTKGPVLGMKGRSVP